MKIFYYDAESQNNFVDDESIESIDEVIEEFFYLSDEEGSFFGLVSENEQVVQFGWEKEDIWHVDIPLKSTFESDDIRTSLQKFSNYDECINIIKNVYEEKNIHNLYKVLIMKETLENIKSQTTALTQYKLEIKGSEDIQSEFTYSGWEKGLFLYWSYKNNLLVSEVEKVIKSYSEELKELNHKILLDIVKNSIGDKIDVEFFKEENREFVIDYIFSSTEEYCFYIDIQELYSNIKDTNEIPESSTEYNKIMQIFDKRFEEYKQYSN